jgi:DNA-binding MarR family transcriptional regulator
MAELRAGANLLFLREEQLRQGIELLFYAQRDFNAAAEALLQRHGLGHAHLRAIYFIGRHSGISVTELLTILGVTKQSLWRVLGDLVKRGLVVQRPGLRDRRKRLLELTEAGAELERELSENQRARFAEAFRAAGPEAVEGFRKVMLGLIDEADRGRFQPVRPGRR